jgi:hypothetical protein
MVLQLNAMAEACAYAGDQTAAARYLIRAEQWAEKLEEAKAKEAARSGIK